MACGVQPCCLVVADCGHCHGGCRLGGYLSIAMLVFVIMIFIGIFWCAACLYLLTVSFRAQAYDLSYLILSLAPCSLKTYCWPSSALPLLLACGDCIFNLQSRLCAVASICQWYQAPKMRLPHVACDISMVMCCCRTHNVVYLIVGIVGSILFSVRATIFVTPVPCLPRTLVSTAAFHSFK